MPRNENDVRDAVKYTAEMTGRQISAGSLAMFVADLVGFTADQICDALALCRKELRTFPTTADVISRIPNGHPGPEEAWALCPHDEGATAVWTDEIAAAFGIARTHLAGDRPDKIAARMAFLESYRASMAVVRAQNKAPKWTISFGQDVPGRSGALAVAVEKGRITMGRALVALPEFAFTEEGKRLLTTTHAADPKVKALAGSSLRSLPNDSGPGRPDAS